MSNPTPPPIFDAAELRAKALAATPGPWQSLRDGNQYVETSYMPCARGVARRASRVAPLVRPWNPHAYLAFGFKPKEFETARFLDADADYIAAANPQTLLALLDERATLLARVEAAEAERDELRGKNQLLQDLIEEGLW